MDELINTIAKYIKWLKENKDYNIAIHLFPVRFKFVMDRLIKFNIHNNPYCLAVKSNTEMWNKCVKSQNKILCIKSSEPFFGMCHAGICEFVFPLISSETLGFISITGYCSDLKKAAARINKIAENSCISGKQLLKQYKLSTTSELPDFDEMKALIDPIRQMIYRLDELTSVFHYDVDSFSNNEEFIVNQLINYLSRNFSAKLTLGSLSETCHCSKSTMSRIFKEHTGVTIMDYLLDVRMKEAERLLSDTVFSVQEIGEICGFSDANYFSYTFRKNSGMTPTEYRKDHISKKIKTAQ